VKATRLQEISIQSKPKNRTLIRVPAKSALRLTRRLRRAIVGAFLSPMYCLLALHEGGPGLAFRWDSTQLALRLLRRRTKQISIVDVCRLFVFPMDSVRYFEFNFVWDVLASHSIHSYLDVSSPRLFPLMLVMKNQELHADLINPDAQDLTVTRNLATSLNLQRRCDFHNCLISSAPFEPGSFDVVTSISVVEHIPDDTEAVRKMWGLLKPGGRLLLTVPCAATAGDEFIDKNEYGVLEPDEDGLFFFQRFYDEQLLADNIFTVIGAPDRYSVYGEKTPGTYHSNQRSKMADPEYPSWREPYMMAKDYGYFDSVSDLPGIGVIGMEFVKT
jgi:SAM-dependent methyltransferase